MGMTQKLYLSAGCLWCSESIMGNINGVIKVIPGYIPNPSLRTPKDSLEMIEYIKIEQYRESLEIEYDPQITSLNILVQEFLNSIDPTDKKGSFIDRGFKYTTAIYIDSDQQKEIILSVFEQYKKEHNINIINVQILTKTVFYPLTEKYRSFAKKNPIEYKKYYNSSGRNEYFKLRYLNKRSL